MEHEFRKIIRELEDDPAGFVARCDEAYEEQIRRAAGEIARRRHELSIVLLTGPSGSGKTTTSIKLVEELKKHGVGAVSVSMDNYFLDYDPVTSPRMPDGSRDMESPLCLDLELMGAQFRALTRGEEVKIPTFDFSAECRHPTKVRTLRLAENDVAIFEGINALNDMITEFDGVKSWKLFVTVTSGLYENGKGICSPRKVRLLRRMIRDQKFRGASPEYTYNVWQNVVRGEKLYIKPTRHKADMEIDTFLPYELSIIRRHLLPLIEGMDEMSAVCELLRQVPPLDEALVPPSSLVREFIGGSKYKY